MKIIPWKCHICDKEFETLKGGLCKICNEPTCLSCFGHKAPQKGTLNKDFKNQTCRTCAALKEGHNK